MFILGFVLGFVLGGLFGIFLMGLIIGGKKGE